MAIGNRQVRAAREFLRKRGIKGISPRLFVQGSQETGLNFRELLDFLAEVAHIHDDTDGVRDRFSEGLRASPGQLGTQISGTQNRHMGGVSALDRANLRGLASG